MKTISASQLKPGEFAITDCKDDSDYKMVLLGVSPRSFTPKLDEYVNVVHVANGIGAFTANTQCRKVTRKEALEYLLAHPW